MTKQKSSRLDRVENAISEIARMLEAQGNAINFLLNEHAKQKKDEETNDDSPAIDLNAKL